MKVATKTYSFRHAAIIIMCIIFLMNLILSSEYNLLWILLSGGGNIIDYLGESYKTVFSNFQLYRLITYGYTQTAIWHLLANVFGLWYVGIYVFYPNSFNYGASPAIFACLGVLVNWLIRNRTIWNEYKTQKGFHFLLYYFVLSNFLGICTFVIHLLGFCTGFLLGFVVKKKQ